MMVDRQSFPVTRGEFDMLKDDVKEMRGWIVGTFATSFFTLLGGFGFVVWYVMLHGAR